MYQEDKVRIIRSLFYPSLLVALMWIIHILNTVFELGLTRFGLHPLQLKGLTGIITAPLLHADFAHLFANSIPLMVLIALLFYFYSEIALMILILIWLITGTWVWTFARGEGIHIGASGIVYGLTSFLFFSGIIRREKALMVITLLVTFLYGGLIWGIFPQLFPNQPISWESHLMGLIAGLVLAVYYRRKGPQKEEWDWGEEEEDAGEDKPSWDDPEVHNQPPVQ